MATGEQLVALAETRLGEKYINVVVPKDNAGWHGPWDCAEFASWLVYQKVQKLFGCTNNAAAPAIADAYSGAWFRDASDGTLLRSSEDEAVNTAGIFLIRKPPSPGHMGHVAVSDGQGRTIEAAGVGLGVRRDKIRGRVWDVVVKVPQLGYSATGHWEPAKPLPTLLRLDTPNVKSPLVRRVQQALRKKGFDPGKIDGEYGPHTVAAVVAFQTTNKLVADGICGPRTAEKLGIDWP